MSTKHANKRKHPLHPVVVEIAKRVGLLDTPKLAHELCGRVSFRGRRAAGAIRAYQTVAEDVLGYMYDQGVLVYRPDGWYQFVTDEHLEPESEAS